MPIRTDRCRVSFRRAPAAPARGGRAFSLIELLVAVGAIAVLLGILLPAVGRARYQSRVVVCASHIRQLSLAVYQYAVANEDNFPPLDMPGTGANLWDVSNEFCDALRKQCGLKYDDFFCPLTENRTAADAAFDTYGFFKIFGYNVWIPRLNGGVYMPPLVPGTFTDKYSYPRPTSTEPFCGPRRLSDKLTSVNPIFTDFAGSDGQDPPADADISRPGNPYGLSILSNHQWRGGAIDNINAGYADGHVEAIPGSQVRPRYKGNRWNWR